MVIIRTISVLFTYNYVFFLYEFSVEITFFSDKRLEKAETQEDYEKIWPIGTLFVTSANERLRGKTTSGLIAGVSRTVGHTPVSASAARSAAGQHGPSRNGDATRGRPMQKSASSSIMMSTDTVPRNSRPVAKVVTPPVNRNGRALAAVNATMPRSILQKAIPSQEASRNNVQPPALPTSVRPTKGSPSQEPRSTQPQNHTSGNSRPNGSATRGRDQKPPPLTTTPSEAYRKRSPSVGSTAFEYTNSQRNRSPSVGSRPEQVLVSPTGRVRKGPIINHSPTIADAFKHRTDSSTSSTDADYSHLKTLPVDIPAPDYPDDTVFQYPSTGSSKAMEARYGAPPTPPPISSIPARSNKVPAPTLPQTTAVDSSSTLSSPASSLSSIPGAIAPPPPPAPNVPGPPPPPPPPPPAINWIPPSQQVSHTPVVKRQPQPINNNESSMDTMMAELKKAQQRRMSRGTDLEDAVDSAKTAFNAKQSPRTTGALKSQASSGENELQSILNGRFKKTSVDGSPGSGGNILPVARRPSPGRFRGGNQTSSTNETFGKLEDIPSKLQGLTVAQVGQCLHLLNLDKYIVPFKKNIVDGEMIMTLNKNILRSEFGVSEFDIQKILKFIQGWRPK